ncbi:4-diphosphocytidyl-2C-methyl-D-erythritol kinase [Magnetospirillum gryphiswaldense]|uniref:Molybdopterin biosynthesis protein n=1 Tax=Magnetospirillum gryphiswaldense TaxID=55518 RepID=A4TWK4_9PROT|nr:4-diphosphocytidyl-2C-methyl-D-erythritol kinase [Magnetospirillum gryphiswaldense]AVM73868.1 hypothetical protein MSR1_13760 [Magnetospirillum gryphiswaldense MSR-1]AVM77771.1 hypothetical protein MSR1L_13760 [Magnetospirillum gryphiswaldense]CAM75011.1 molybdopterin biosynthesis protein [Magnetospirillum gryphiswaldense MSR-1]
MQFGEVRIDEAEGLILAHSLRLPTAMLKKGRLLSAVDIALLKQAGLNFVTGARLEAGDLGENDAAQAVANALTGPGVQTNGAFAGRCNLFATQGGVVVIDRDRLDRLNLVDEAVTVATVPPFVIARPRQMIATIKIIPFGVSRHTVDACAAYASTGGPLISVRPIKPFKAALILTTLPGIRDKTLASAAAVTRTRAEGLGGTITAEYRCPHDIGQLERCLTKALAAGHDMVLIIGASATVDRRDVAPAALQKAGGSIDHFGMPVDPGNLLLLGHVGTVPVVTLPGCARSPKPNGLDWVLARLAAGVTLKPADIMRMGAGGLLKDLGGQAGAAWPGITTPTVLPRAAAIVLAGDGDGLRAVETALAAGLEPLVVVASTTSEAAEENLPPCDIRLLREDANPFAAGLAALPDDVEAALVFAQGAAIPVSTVGDMLKALEPEEGRAIITAGDSCLIDCSHFGATSLAILLADHAEQVLDLPISAKP